MRFTPEQEERVDAVNRAMRDEFFAHLAEQNTQQLTDFPTSAAKVPSVLFVRANFDALLGDDHDELAARFRKAAQIAAMCSVTASWDATAVYGSRPGQPACWRIVLG